MATVSGKNGCLALSFLFRAIRIIRLSLFSVWMVLRTTTSAVFLRPPFGEIVLYVHSFAGFELIGVDFGSLPPIPMVHECLVDWF
ncbi:hypothetical protein V6N13_070538 [Hibiscus sabdariffa]|uniref:Uncharacterized protein n=1 Tax=Hibiscus sabdariffa TaxID=183260 RepID=A0ABR2TGE4_9ROSI